MANEINIPTRDQLLGNPDFPQEAVEIITHVTVDKSGVPTSTLGKIAFTDLNSVTESGDGRVIIAQVIDMIVTREEPKDTPVDNKVPVISDQVLKEQAYERFGLKIT